MFKARASKAGELMVGGTYFTESDAALLAEYRQRKTNSFISQSGRKLGPIKDMDEKIAALEARKAAGFEFGATSKSFIAEQWLYDKYKYRQIVVTKEMLKGQMCEQDSIELTQEVLGGAFRLKCKERRKDDYHTGMCDVDLPSENTVEDNKTSWDMMTFLKVEEVPELYYAQAQVYMRLYGRDHFRLIYTLVPTPMELVEKELRRYMYMYDGGSENPHYREIEEQMYWNHIEGVLQIPAEQRVKVFSFNRNQDYIDELQKRVILARDVYDAMTLNGAKELAAKAA